MAALPSRWRFLGVPHTPPPSLSWVGDSAPPPPLLVLNFSAVWCPDCTPRTPQLAQMAEKHGGKMHVLYVPSDNDQGQMQSVVEKKGWSHVNYEGKTPNGGDHAAALKRRFGVCAAKEQQQLGISWKERKGGLPTIVVLRSDDGRVIDEDGWATVEEVGADAAVESWSQKAANNM